MKIIVKVKSRAKIERVEELDKIHYTVSVKEPPIEGRANVAAAAALAEHFGVPRRNVSLVSGHTSRQKVFEVRL